MLQVLQKDECPTRPVLDKRFIVDLKGKEFVTYAGLLDLAHQHGLTELKVEIVQIPTQDNGFECLVQATAVTESGAMFSDLGDANPHNCNKSVAQHIIRMASTRAKARVLRDLSNIGITALEELGGDNVEVPGNGNGNGKARAKPRKAASIDGPPSKVGKDETTDPITDAQKRAIWSLAKSRGHDETTLHDLAESTFGCGVAALGSRDAAALIKQLQAY